MPRENCAQDHEPHQCWEWSAVDSGPLEWSGQGSGLQTMYMPSAAPWMHSETGALSGKKESLIHYSPWQIGVCHAPAGPLTTHLDSEATMPSKPPSQISLCWYSCCCIGSSILALGQETKTELCSDGRRVVASSHWANKQRCNSALMGGGSSILALGQ